MKMSNVLLIALIILLIANNVDIPLLHKPLFYLFHRSVTLFHIIVFGFLIYLSQFVGSPFREIIAVILILWLLSTFGIFFIFGWFSNLILFVILILLLFSIL